MTFVALSGFLCAVADFTHCVDGVHPFASLVVSLDDVVALRSVVSVGVCDVVLMDA